MKTIDCEILLGIGKEWVVDDVRIDEPGKRIDIFLKYNEREGACPECGESCRLHDKLPERTWRHLDTMQFTTVIHARRPRTVCPKHGVKVIELPWAEKHARHTRMFETFAIDVIQRARSIKDAQKLLRLGWHQTFRIMDGAVARGMARRGADEIPFIGMDEKSFRSGMKAECFISVMVDLEGGRVLDVERGRSSETAVALIKKALIPSQREKVRNVAIDMSAPYRKAIREMLPNAGIVYDKFHVKAHLCEAVDKVRRIEHARLLKKHDKRLSRTKHLWLKNWEHLSDESRAWIEDLLKEAFDVGKAWSLKESFDNFWKCQNKSFAESFFDVWFKEALETKLAPVVKVAKMLKRHLDGLLSWFDCRITNAGSEGFNSKIQALKAAARGFRNPENYRTSILFFCGKLNMAPAIP